MIKPQFIQIAEEITVNINAIESYSVEGVYLVVHTPSELYRVQCDSEDDAVELYHIFNTRLGAGEISQ